MCKFFWLWFVFYVVFGVVGFVVVMFVFGSYVFFEVNFVCM